MNERNNHFVVYILLAFIIILSFYIIAQQYVNDQEIYDFLTEFETQTQREHANLERKIISEE